MLGMGAGATAPCPTLGLAGGASLRFDLDESGECDRLQARRGDEAELGARRLLTHTMQGSTIRDGQGATGPRGRRDWSRPCPCSGCLKDETGDGEGEGEGGGTWKGQEAAALRGGKLEGCTGSPLGAVVLYTSLAIFSSS